MANEIIFYRTPDGEERIEVIFRDENFWMTQKALAELFGVNVPTISKHLKNILESGELAENSVVSKMETTAADGKNYWVGHYNLDAIIAVGYRVNSYQATQFRIWATKTLKQYIIKGFVMDDERLKQGKSVGKDYFDELLERIREILAAKRAAYGKEILSTLSKELVADFGKGFSVPNLSRMMAFAEAFPDRAVATSLSAHLGWSHAPHPPGAPAASHTPDSLPVSSPRQSSYFAGLTGPAATCLHNSHNTRVSFGEAVWGRLFGVGPCCFSEVVA